MARPLRSQRRAAREPDRDADLLRGEALLRSAGTYGIDLGDAVELERSLRTRAPHPRLSDATGLLPGRHRLVLAV